MTVRGLPLSLLLHAGVGAAFVVAWGTTMRTPEYVPAVPVEIISEAELGEILSVPEEIKVEDAPVEEEPAAPEEIEDVPPPVVEETPSLPPEPDPEPVPAEVVDAAVEDPESVAEDPPPPVVDETPPVVTPDPPAPDPEPAEPDFNLDDLGPIDLTPDENRRAPRVTSDNPAASDRNIDQIGDGQTLTITETTQFQAWMSQCWRPISGAPDASSLTVLMRIQFDITGAVENVTVLNNGEIDRSGNRYWPEARRRAVAAANACSPAPFLDPSRYNDWREVDFNFQPPY